MVPTVLRVSDREPSSGVNDISSEDTDPTQLMDTLAVPLVSGASL